MAGKVGGDYLNLYTWPSLSTPGPPSLHLALPPYTWPTQPGPPSLHLALPTWPTQPDTPSLHLTHGPLYLAHWGCEVPCL